MSGLSLAYFCSQYPAVSHTFINREIEKLEANGVTVHPFSMRPGVVLPGGTDFEHAQLKATYCIHTQSRFTQLFSQFAMLARSPIGYIRGLLFAIALQKGRLKESLWAIFHFVEAAILVREMRKRGVNHVHVHFANSEAYIAMYASVAFGITYSFTLHGPDCFYNVELGSLREKINRAAFVVCISNFARGQAMRLSRIEDFDKFDIVHCGVDPDKYRPFPDKKNADVFTIVCTGRLTTTKGQALLVMACADLIKAGRKLHCKFIGGGEEQATLQALIDKHGIGDSVVLTGPLPQNGVLEALKEADVFCLPTFAEGVPVVLMEAMSMEIPTISTRVGGIAELMDSGKNSYLIHSGDPDSLHDLLARLMDTPQELEAIGKEARKFVQEEFDVRKNASILAEVFTRRIKDL